MSRNSRLFESSIIATPLLNVSSSFPFGSLSISPFSTISGAPKRTSTAMVSLSGSASGSVSLVKSKTPAPISQIARDLIEYQKKSKSPLVSSSLAVSGSSSVSTSLPAYVPGSASVELSIPQTDDYFGLSKIEEEILKSKYPIEVNETEEVEADGHRGILANKQEIINWKGSIPLSEYPINKDNEPIIITKKATDKLQYMQELAIRYLKPPTPPPPGEIVIQEEGNKIPVPAPPLILRQQPPRPQTPEPLVIRETPPSPPPSVGKKVIKISGKQLPPPPRKVVIERLPPLPPKPQAVLVERWLSYPEVKRKVILKKPVEKDPVFVPTRNIVVQWESPETEIKKNFKYLGVVKANPADYVKRYGSSLMKPNQLPEYVKEIKTPEGLELASEKKSSFYKLEGDINALKLVDLEKEGLTEYRSLLESSMPLASASIISSSLSHSRSGTPTIDTVVEKIFNSISKNGATVTVDDAERAILKLNTRLSRKYSQTDVKSFFSTLDRSNSGTLSISEFKEAFTSITI